MSGGPRSEIMLTPTGHTAIPVDGVTVPIAATFEGHVVELRESSVHVAGKQLSDRTELTEPHNSAQVYGSPTRSVARGWM